MRTYLFVLGTATAALASSTIASEPTTALIVFGNDTVFAEVADSPDERSEGLMNRSEVPDGTGMLFVFEFESNDAVPRVETCRVRLAAAQQRNTAGTDLD